MFAAVEVVGTRLQMPQGGRLLSREKTRGKSQPLPSYDVRRGRTGGLKPAAG